jgi:hypothetical protein
MITGIYTVAQHFGTKKAHFLPWRTKQYPNLLVNVAKTPASNPILLTGPMLAKPFVQGILGNDKCAGISPNLI